MSTPNQLSFLPEDYLERKAQRRANAICGVLFVLVMAGICSAFTLSEKATQRLDAEFARVDQLYVGEAKRLDQVKMMQDKQRRMAHQADLSASLLERVPRSFLLADITNSIPAGASLLDLTLEAKPRAKSFVDTTKTAYEQKKAATKQTSGGPPQAEPRLYDVCIKITGVARNDVQVAQFLNRLTRSKLLRDVNLVISEEHKQDKEMLRKFQVEMNIDPEAEVTASDKEKQIRRSAVVELKE